MENKKKEIYEMPQIEVIALSDEDVIRTSDDGFEIEDNSMYE